METRSKRVMSRPSSRQSGAVSIFIVIFSALLITVITISFMRIVVRDQQQASATDLSQSAYDSAQAGVEDAKRALLLWQDACRDGGSDCTQIEDIIRAKGCNTVPRILEGRASSDMSETKVQQTGSSADAALNQAYTCTVINIETNNYQGRLEADESTIIRLKGTGRFDRISLSWFTTDDLGSGTSANLTNQITLPNTWHPNRPPIMRTQLIRAGSNFTLNDFNENSGSSTLYLYPSSSGLADRFDFATDARLNAKSIDNVGCRSTLSGSGLYFCSATIEIPDGGIGVDDMAFLRLVAHYKSTQFEISLYNGEPNAGNLVPFDGVQPEVDSTGRANDLFRRVSSRIELLDTTFPYPEAAVDIQGDFCKTFLVTDRAADYQPGDCTP